MISLPTIQGVIKRRILVNYRADPGVIQKILPSKFRPKLHDGHAVAGICLIRLEQIRPLHVPAFLGISSENAAHRIAVVWTDSDNIEREGVFIPRRDTSSQLNHLVGGRIFPGEHNHAKFKTHETEDSIELKMVSDDKTVAVEVAGEIANALPSASIFESLDSASTFFEGGSLGYSVTRNAYKLDGMVLDTKEWVVEALQLSSVSSSFYSDNSLFPSGSITFDHALIMRNIQHEWHSVPEMEI